MQYLIAVGECEIGEIKVWFHQVLVISVSLLLTVHSGLAADPQISIEIRQTATPDDDYLTWAPAPARIRQAPTAGAGDITVVLTNDPPGPTPAGRRQPLDGDVAFDLVVPQGETATKDQLLLTLPKDGSWVSFVVAGKFPRWSSKDKDAVIEVHRDSASGVVLHRHALMVRVRKDHRELTDEERNEFLKALRYLRWTAKAPNGESLYEEFVKLHTVATGLIEPRPYDWYDMAHKGPAFIAWHRAFLLQFERTIQEKFPSVSLPYWTMPDASKLFNPHFLGANAVGPTEVSVDAELDALNPLFGWKIGGKSIPRWSVARDGSALLDFDKDVVLFKRKTFSNYPQRATETEGFVEGVESNPHNIGHGWVGSWMGSCQTSPRDPIFWIFHTGFDRQWASWQHAYDRFHPLGQNDSYRPLGKFEQQVASAGACNAPGENECTPIGHNSDDPMWPWNDKWGRGETFKGSWPDRTLFDPFVQNFPVSRMVGLWPKDPAKPTPADMIDYFGMSPGRLDMGFAYDVAPYGPSPQRTIVMAGSQESIRRLQIFTDRSQPEHNRLEAVSKIDVGELAKDHVDDLSKLVKAPQELDAVRLQGLNLLQKRRDADWMSVVVSVLESGNRAGSGEFEAQAIGTLMTGAMLTAEGNRRHHEVARAIRLALDDTRRPVRVAAVRALAPMGDRPTLETLAAVLRQPAGKAFTAVDALQGIRISENSLQYSALVRPFLNDADSVVRTEAIKTLNGDKSAEPRFAELLLDRSQPFEVRAAAAGTVTGGTGGVVVPALQQVMTNQAEDTALRSVAAASLGVFLEANADKLSRPEIEDISSSFALAQQSTDTKLRQLGERGRQAALEILRRK